MIHKIDLPNGDDLPRHIKNGELILHGDFSVLYSNIYSYTEPEHRFINHHWLSGVIFYLFFIFAGWSSLVILKTIVLLSTFSILFFTALKKANFWLVSIFSLPTVLILAERTDVRPEIFSLLFISIFLYILTSFEKNPNSKNIFWLVFIQLLWVNLHIFFIIGIMLTLGFLFEKIIINWGNLKGNILIKRLGVLSVGLILVSFINPNGISGVMNSVLIFNNYGITVSELDSLSYVFENEPISDIIPILIFVLSIPVLALSFIFGIKKDRLFYFLAFVGTATVGILMRRNIVFFAFIFLPAITLNLNFYFEILIKNKIWKKVFLKNILILLFATTALMLSWLGINSKISVYNQSGIGLVPRSEEASIFLKENKLLGPIFNDFDSGSYLIQSLFPEEKVFVDNRAEAYSESFFKNIYLPSMQDETVWQEVMKKYDFNLIFLSLDNQAPYFHQFVFNRIKDPEWSLIFANSSNVIFLRKKAENFKLIKQFEITSINVSDRIRSLAESSEFDDLVAAGDIFNLLERQDLGAETHLKIVNKWPNKSKIWMIMGIWRIAGKEEFRDPALAAQYLEHAIELGQKNARAYYFLSLSYSMMGNTLKAKAAMDHSLEIDPQY